MGCAPPWQAGGCRTTMLRGETLAHDDNTSDLSLQSAACYALPEGVKLEGTSLRYHRGTLPLCRQ